MADLTWSPAASPFLTTRQAAVARSRLTFSDGLLAWSPAGLPSSAPGGRPFTARVGSGPGEASEMVWITGTVALSARGLNTLDAEVLAVCTPDPTGPGGRRVLGYVSAALLSAVTGDASQGDARRDAEERGRGMAAAMGLRFSVEEVGYGRNPNRDFPGSMRYGGFSVAMAWLTAITWLVGGVGLLGVYISWVVRGKALPASFLAILGAVLLVLGLLTLPPVMRHLKGRYARR